MPIIFQCKKGRVVRLQDDASALCDIRLIALNPELEYKKHSVIVTRVAVSKKTNAQFLHSLGSKVYVYVFGDRVGMITLSGIAFSKTCEAPNVVGVDSVLAWYRANKVSNRMEPIQVTVGNTVMEGMVVEMSVDVVDPAVQLVQWNIGMVLLPEDER